MLKKPTAVGDGGEEKSELVGTARGLWEGCRVQQERGGGGRLMVMADGDLGLREAVGLYMRSSRALVGTSHHVLEGAVFYI